MPTASDSLACSMFGEEASNQNYVALGVRNPPWREPPKHALSIPADWQSDWKVDFKISPLDFVPRDMALHEAAAANRKALEESDDGLPFEWLLIFRVGAWEDTSFLVFDPAGRSTLLIDTRLMLVRPTTDEVKRFGQLPAQIGGAV